MISTKEGIQSQAIRKRHNARTVVKFGWIIVLITLSHPSFGYPSVERQQQALIDRNA